MPSHDSRPVSAAEARAMFADLASVPALILAVSGGPDSVALMLLAVRWRDQREAAPKLIAVTVDHGLREESKAEAAAVARLARRLKIAHRIVRWTGVKPKTGLQQAARAARYRLLAAAARQAGASHVLTAHTLNDQAETVLIRMARGSGLTGLAAMQRGTALPGDKAEGLLLIRPLLELPKSRLIATLTAAGTPYADDPSNRDPRFTRARLRKLMGELAGEGLDAARLSLLARRLGRADQAIEAAVAKALAELRLDSSKTGLIAFDLQGYCRLPAEIALRLLGRAVTTAGDEGPVELAKLEALKEGLDAALSGKQRFRRSLAGAIVTLTQDRITVERAPPRRGNALTTRRTGPARPPRTR
ncbi:MAG: tRNA lysidine(34) synthetase TilS [Pseudolabrys sp.]|nr:tRNA lysidine(34) synthetase TilS [Pseudolabrys sp.]